MIILIPAYEPDGRLLELIDTIRQRRPRQQIVIVDDGSGARYAPVFAVACELGCDIIGYADNRGKGAALRYGFAYVAAHYLGHDVVCADCDGQHLVDDIDRVGAAVAAQPDAIVLGSRRFVGDVPPRSRFGNTLTRQVFHVASGSEVYDTQTGLRGYPAELLPWLQTIGGDRFEYELDVLLAAQHAGLPVREVTIATVYLNGNESSHFRTIRDSLRVAFPLLRFCASSIAAFVIDLVVLLTMMHITDRLLLSVVTARLASSTANFLTNRRFVFTGARVRRFGSTALRYFSLVALIVATNFALMRALIGLGLGVLAAKLVTEAALFAISFRLQQRWVFGSASPTATAAATAVDSQQTHSQLTPQPELQRVG